MLINCIPENEENMKYNRFLSLSIIVLAISVIFGSLWIGYSIQEASKVETCNITLDNSVKGLISETEAAEYLSLTVVELRSIIKKNIADKEALSSYSTYRFMPYLELDNGVKLFNLKELDEWISFNTHNKY